MPPDTVVHVIDDDDAARDSLVFLLKTAGIRTVAYESAEHFLDSLPIKAGGCVVTDIRMPGTTGIELMGRLKQLDVNVPVIVMTGHGDVPLAVEAMKSGASDFLEKPFDDETMLAAVNAAINRNRDDGAREAEKKEIAERLATLSNRERQVLEGLVIGHPNKTIGYDLGISARTIEIYRANVMSKMGASSLSDLVRMAIVAGVSITVKTGPR
jgi:two-component system response regulator FixJ